MKMNAYSVYDLKSKTYQLPFYAANDVEAIRSMDQHVNSGDKKSNVCNYPEDYCLRNIGSFDPENAFILDHEITTIIQIGDLVKIQRPTSTETVDMFKNS